MTTVPVYIEIIQDPLWLLEPNARNAEHNRVLREAFHGMAEGWAQAMLPKHFTREAEQLYHYQPRTKRTQIRKRMAAKKGKAILGGLVDLVWSGFLMRAILGHQSITSTPNGAKCRMFAPRYMFQYKPNQPDKAGEITTVIEIEAGLLRQRLDVKYQIGLKNFRAKEVIKITP